MGFFLFRVLLHGCGILLMVVPCLDPSCLRRKAENDKNVLLWFLTFSETCLACAATQKRISPWNFSQGMFVCHKNKLSVECRHMCKCELPEEALGCSGLCEGIYLLSPCSLTACGSFKLKRAAALLVLRTQRRDHCHLPAGRNLG